MIRLPVAPAVFALVALAGSTSVVACGAKASSEESPTKDGGSEDTGLHLGVDEDTGTRPRADGGVRMQRGDAGVSAADVMAETRKDAALPATPLLINSDGGVIASPTIVAVFFSNEDPTLLPTLEQAYSGIGTSEVWQAGAEYGIGPATAQNVVLTEAAPATIDDTPDQAGDNTALQNWLLAAITAKTLPAWTPSTIYMLNYPTGTTVTSNGNSCTDFDGYHGDTQDSANDIIAYGVVPRCTDQGSTTLVTFTSTISHELVEAATDPYPDYSPGWAQVDNPHLFFDEANEGTEVADMCENDPEAYYEFPGYPFTVQRIWSNKAVLAGHDPCVPELPNTVFFNAVPELPDTGPYNYYGSTVDVASVHIAVGGTATVYIDLYSDGATPDWDVNVFDFNNFNYGPASDDLLTISQPITTGNNGSRLAVTVTVKAAGNPMTNGQIENTELFAVVSSQGTSQSSPAHYWYGIITN